MISPRFSLEASVISYNYVRFLSSTLGFGMRRDGDYFFIYKNYPETGGYYVEKDTEQKSLGRLYIDEGYYSDAIYEGFNYNSENKFLRLPNSRSWEEVCDAADFMSIICKAFDPDRKFEHPPFIGRGRNKRFMQRQYATAIRELVKTDCLLKHWDILD